MTPEAQPKLITHDFDRIRAKRVEFQCVFEKILADRIAQPDIRINHIYKLSEQHWRTDAQLFFMLWEDFRDANYQDLGLELIPVSEEEQSTTEHEMAHLTTAVELGVDIEQCTVGLRFFQTSHAANVTLPPNTSDLIKFQSALAVRNPSIADILVAGQAYHSGTFDIEELPIELQERAIFHWGEQGKPSKLDLRNF